MELLGSLWWLPFATFVAGVLTSVVGAGGGVMLLAIMGTVLPPLAVIPVHGVVMLGNNVMRVTQLYRLIDWRFVGAVIAGSAVGSFTAGPILVNLPEQALQFILAMGLLYLVWGPKPKASEAKPTPIRTAILGFGLSILSMAIGAAAVFFAALRKQKGLPKEQILADQSAIMCAQSIFKALAFGLFGFAFGPYIPLIIAMMMCGMLGSWLGVKLLKRMSYTWFDHLFKLVVSIMAGILLVRALGL